MSKKDNISLKWFKEMIEKTVDKAVDKQLNQPIDYSAVGCTNIVVNSPASAVPKEKVYAHLTLVGNVLTVVLQDGSIISKSEATADDFNSVREARSEQEIFQVVATEIVKKQRLDDEKEIAKIKIIHNGLSRLVETGDFKVKDNYAVLKGTTRTIPQLLVENFVEVISKYDDLNKKALKKALEIDDEYQGLKRFFMWCCLNPRAEVANDLYDFLNRNSFRITKQGFFVALRNVVTVNNSEGNKLVAFISNSYNKIKAVWKKNPGHYFVEQLDNGYVLIKDTDVTNDGNRLILGRLTDLYLDLPNMVENRFTDAHTRTFDIRVGRVVDIPMNECDWSTADCAHAGLHFTSDEIHYVGCGDTSVLVLINPMKVVGIGSHKGRCYEYLPIMTVPRDEATQILHDGEFDTYQLDEQYAISELESLQEKAQLGFVTETTKHQFNLPSISLKEINNLVASLQEMTGAIKDRINLVE
jgi:hypothetical protein